MQAITLLHIDKTSLISHLVPELIAEIEHQLCLTEKALYSPVTSKEATNALETNGSVAILYYRKYKRLTTSDLINIQRCSSFIRPARICDLKHSFRERKESWIDDIIGLYPLGEPSIDKPSLQIGSLPLNVDIVVFDPRTIYRVFLQRFKEIDLETSRARTKKLVEEYFREICTSETIPEKDKKRYAEICGKYIDELAETAFLTKC